MLSTTDILLRVGLAFFAGMLVGVDRETHGRAAGLRTTILVCVATALGMILSHGLTAWAALHDANWHPDPGRLAAGMLTGMGFLGAGSIMRQENVVRGVTTAAMLWFVSVLGLAFGAGEIKLGLIGLGVALVTLSVLPFVERSIKSDWYGRVSITTEMSALTEELARQQLESLKVRVNGLDLEYDIEHGRRTMSFEIRARPADVFAVSEQIVQHFAKQQGVLQVKWQ
jgi:putative Mg2+ transporter-C (MgtC) family protein